MRIYYERADGSVIITHNIDPADNGFNTIQEWIDWHRPRLEQSLTGPPITVEHSVDDGDFLSDFRDFRNAWQLSGTDLVTHMGQARDIKTDHVRKERVGRFTPFDVAYVIADEKNDALGKAAASQARQKLRDMPATIQPDLAAITDPDKLRDYEAPWPE